MIDRDRLIEINDRLVERTIDSRFNREIRAVSIDLTETESDFDAIRVVQLKINPIIRSRAAGG